MTINKQPKINEGDLKEPYREDFPLVFKNTNFS